MENPLNWGSDKGDDGVIDLGGAVGSTPSLRFHFLKARIEETNQLRVNVNTYIKQTYATKFL